MKLSRKRLFKKGILAIAALFVVVAGLVFGTLKPKPANEDPSHTFSITADDRYEIRATSSPYTVVEFLDLDCVYCKSLHEQKERYLNDFKSVNLIIRNYPLLDSGRSAYKVLVGECVAQQMGDEAWFRYIDLSYEAFDKRFNNTFFENMGRDLVVDTDKFNRCLADTSLMDGITKEKASNQINQVTYVPTFIIFKDGIYIKKYDGISTRLALEVLRYYNNLSMSGQ